MLWKVQTHAMTGRLEWSGWKERGEAGTVITELQWTSNIIEQSQSPSSLCLTLQLYLTTEPFNLNKTSKNILKWTLIKLYYDIFCFQEMDFTAVGKRETCPWLSDLYTSFLLDLMFPYIMVQAVTYVVHYNSCKFSCLAMSWTYD